MEGIRISADNRLAIAAAILAAGESVGFYEERDAGPRGLAHPVVSKPFACGRNHPCPCGSGRKFKRCCNGKEAPRG
jgi:uncharacterized protein YecA (UPF0149 family)